MKLFFLIIITLIPIASHAGLYKWIDENGKTHYGDKKPGDNSVEALQRIKSNNINTDIFNSNIVGSWESNKGKLTARVTIEENGKFNGIVKENNNVAWVYNGTWKLEGKNLTWNYKQSRPPLPSAMKGKPDVNKVLSLDENTMILREANGKTTKYQKKK